MPAISSRVVHKKRPYNINMSNAILPHTLVVFAVGTRSTLVCSYDLRYI